MMSYTLPLSKKLQEKGSDLSWAIDRVRTVKAAIMIKRNNAAIGVRDGEKINFFDFLSIRLALSIISKKLHLSIKNRFCLELQKSQKTWTFLYEIQFWTTLTNIE